MIKWAKKEKIKITKKRKGMIMVIILMQKI